jgi:hypothetical protein
MTDQQDDDTYIGRLFKELGKIKGTKQYGQLEKEVERFKNSEEYAQIKKRTEKIEDSKHAKRLSKELNRLIKEGLVQGEKLQKRVEQIRKEK